MALRMALLGLLVAEGPATGYTLAKSFSGSLDHVWKASHSQIYPELAKMADSGLIEASDEIQSRGAKYYSVTESGRTELQSWLTEVEPTRTVRNEIALRSFLLSTLEPGQAISLLDREMEHYRVRSEMLIELKKTLDSSVGQEFGYFSAELGHRISDAIYEWSEWAKGKMEEKKTSSIDE